MIRRFLAVLGLTAFLVAGTGAAVDAGELCTNLKLPQPLGRIPICLPTSL